MKRWWATVTWMLIWTLLVYLGGILFDAELLMACGAGLHVSLWVFGMSELGHAVALGWLVGIAVIAGLGTWRKLPGTRDTRPGACPSCGYDCLAVPLGPNRSRTCPECGGAVLA